jgi:hypothetical protein
MSKVEEKHPLPPMSIGIEIGAGKYTINFPTNGQLIDIERYKNQLTAGTINQMLQNGSHGAQAFLISSAIATFEVLIPDLHNDLKKPLLELNPYQSRNIVKAYEQYYEWMEKWRAVLNQDADKSDEVEEEGDE